MTRNRKNKPAPVPPANPPNRDSVFVVKESHRESAVVNEEGKSNCEESSQSVIPSVAESTQMLLGFERLLAAEKQNEETEKKTDDIKKVEEPERKVEKAQSEPEAVIKPKQEENNKQK